MQQPKKYTLEVAGSSPAVHTGKPGFYVPVFYVDNLVAIFIIKKCSDDVPLHSVWLKPVFSSGEIEAVVYLQGANTRRLKSVPYMFPSTQVYRSHQWKLYGSFYIEGCGSSLALNKKGAVL
jgi:hypothetical protein